MPIEISRTLIVLILKVDNPLNSKMYRPISLCNVVYKTVTKLLANGLHVGVMGPINSSLLLLILLCSCRCNILLCNSIEVAVRLPRM